jgi:hypothetical protein
MPRILAWEELWDCPQKRPFWCSHPHCLWCNWDEEEYDEWKLAAFLGPTLPYERHDDPRFPAGHYTLDRRYVAWLCEECATDSELVRWFANRVSRYYPWAAIVQVPGAPEGAPFTPPPPAPIGRIRTARTPWQPVPITGPIRKSVTAQDVSDPEKGGDDQG